MIMNTLNTLKAQSQLLPSIPITAVNSYKANSMALIEEANSAFKKENITATCAGPELTELIYDNHRHHVQFMTNILRLSDFELLVTIAGWVYRVYGRRVGYDYFLWAYGMWKQAVAAHLPEADSTQINCVYDWMKEHHDDFITIAQNDMNLFSPTITPYESTKNVLIDHMLHARTAKCLLLAREFVRVPDDLKTFYLYVLQPALYEIGFLWECGKISVAHEHLASTIAIRLMAQLHLQFILPEPTKPKMLISASVNELHEIGTRMVSDLAELDGWDVTYLGANTPHQDLILLAKEWKPVIIGLGVAMPFNLEKTFELIATIRQDPTLSNIRIIIGGSVINYLSNPGQIGTADGFAPDAISFLKLANELLPEGF